MNSAGRSGPRVASSGARIDRFRRPSVFAVGLGETNAGRR